MIYETEIEKYYGFNIYTIETIGKGQTSEILKISTDKGIFILKSQLSKDIAINEFRCLHELSKMGLAPEPEITVKHDKYIELGGKTYILMKYINADVIDKSKLDFHNLGLVMNVMHQKLKQISTLQTEDRFDEKRMIENVEDPTLRQIFCEKYKVYSYDASKSNDVIHGDLGRWNLIQQDQKIFIIDFEEVGIGNPFFDIAAVIESLGLNDVEVNQLLNGYGRNNKKSLKKLDHMRMQWKLRGIIFSAAHKLKTKDEIFTLLEEL